MKPSLVVLAALAFASSVSAADAPKPAPAPAPDAPAKPTLKIIPGQVIVPMDAAMRRPWGELISIDLKTRTGTFRNESDDKVMKFTVLPYSELLHHAAFGDLDDFRVGERLIFRLHENQDTHEWTWLTYIQDQMNMMNGHKEYYQVDSIDAAKGELNCTQKNFETNFEREKGIILNTNAETRYWMKGEPAKFADIKVGDRLRAKTHGIGHGKVKVCWEVFLDDESLKKFQDEQKAAHVKRINEEGAPGYVDRGESQALDLTLFQESSDVSHALKAGQSVQVVPVGVDRKPTGEPVHGKVTAAKMDRNLGKVSITLDAPSSTFQQGNLARLWIK